MTEICNRTLSDPACILALPFMISDSTSPLGAAISSRALAPAAGEPGLSAAAVGPAAGAPELGDPTTAGLVNSAGRDGTNDSESQPPQTRQGASVSQMAEHRTAPPGRFAVL